MLDLFGNPVEEQLEPVIAGDRDDQYYVLDGANRPVKALYPAFAAMPDERKLVGRDERDGLTIMTLFMGLDLAGEEDEPLLFRTFVRTAGDGWDGAAYPSWESARAGHAAAVEQYRRLSPDIDDEFPW